MNLKKSFTLIELLVVIAIIGILASIIVLVLLSSRQKAKDIRIQSDLAQIPTLAAVWREDHNGSMDGFCDDSNVEYKKLKDDIIAMGGTVPECKENDTSYAVSTTTKNGTGVSQCVDENYKGEGIATDNPPRCVTSQPTGHFALFHHENRIPVAAQFGVDSMRMIINWMQINPGAGETYDFSIVDNDYSKAISNNVSLFYTVKVGNNPGITNCRGYSTDGSCPPKDEAMWSAYEKFTEKLAEHLKGKVEYFAIENEENGYKYWVGTEDEYFRLRQTAYKGIHAGNPNAKVIDGGLADGAWGAAVSQTLIAQGKDTEAVTYWNNWRRRTTYPQANDINDLKNLLNDNGAAYPNDTNQRAWRYAQRVFSDPNYDIIAFHYRMPYDCLEEVLNYIKSKSGGKPIWNTEGGIFDPPGGTVGQLTAEEKKQEIVKMHLVNFANGVESISYIPMITKGDEMDSYVYLMSDYRTPTEAAAVYKTMTDKLKGFNSISKVAGFSSPDVYRTSVNGKIIYIAWSDNGDKTINLTSVLGSNIKITTYNGSESNSPSDSIAISSGPVYIEAD